MEVVKIFELDKLRAATARVTVMLIADYGQKKAGDEITCHPNMIPILEAKGVIEAGDEVKVSVKSKPAKKKK